MPHKIACISGRICGSNRRWFDGDFCRVGLIMALMCVLLWGCGPTNVYSWKPQAATMPHTRTRPAVVAADPPTDQVGADLLDEAYQQNKVTWVAVPTPDGRRMRWIRLDS